MGQSEPGKGDNVVQFEPRPLELSDAEFSGAERRKLRKMMRQFERIMAGCPTAQREGGD